MSTQSKTLEMGYTEPEFRKTLLGQFIQNTAFSAEELSQQEWLISIENKASVRIKISQAEPRKIAMLTLPVLKTVFKFNNVSATQESDFMKVFFRYFHKGGG